MKSSKVSLIDAFRFAAQGILHACHERNFRIELVFAVAAIVLGLFFSLSPVEWMIVVVCIGLVLGGEALNTALEALVDLVSPGYHEYAKIAKDCAAGAVLLFSLAAFVVGCILFVPRILILGGFL